MTVQARPAAPRAGPARTGRAGAGLAGTGALAKLAFRRDRIMLPAWVYLITVLVATTAYSLKKLYPTAAAQAQLAVTGGGNPALRFLYGRLSGSSLGALTAWRYGIWAAIFGALMTIFIVIRHTRGDEESGRLELVGSAVVGRQAALTTGLLTAVTANLAISVLLCVALPVSGLPVSGSVALALAIGASGLAFTGVAAVAAQLASGARGARGIAFGVLGAAFVIRAIGDSAGASGPSWLSWASPLGWVELTQPFAGPRWWVLALPLAVLALGIAGAFALAARRDLGAGVLPDRPGRPAASGWLRGSFGLAWRLQRGTLAGWVAGVVCIFAASGAAAKGIGSLLGGSTQLRQEFTRLGGQAGSQAARMLGAAMAQLPASLAVTGVAVVLVGLLPRASVACAWTVLGAVVVVDLFGEVLQLSHWVLDISPFTHAPRLPGGTVTAAPLLWLCFTALALSAVGLVAFRRRDVG